MPIDYMRGSISGRQNIEYDGARAYDLQDGERVSADSYQPRLIARIKEDKYGVVRFFQVRTRTTVNMSGAMRLSMAVMGAAGALFASLLNHKDANIYAQCVAAKPKGVSLREFVMPLLMRGLSDKDEHITIAANIYIVNPWVSSDAPNVPVRQEIIDKFNILSV